MVSGKPPRPPPPPPPPPPAQSPAPSPPATATAVARLASPRPRPPEKALRDKDSAECVSGAQQQPRRLSEAAEAVGAATANTRRSLSPSWTAHCEEKVFRASGSIPKARRVSLKANIVSVSYEISDYSADASELAASNNHGNGHDQKSQGHYFEDDVEAGLRSLKRSRDRSWDRKWFSQLEKNRADLSLNSSPASPSCARRTPGRIGTRVPASPEVGRRKPPPAPAKASCPPPPPESVPVPPVPPVPPTPSPSDLLRPSPSPPPPPLPPPPTSVTTTDSASDRLDEAAASTSASQGFMIATSAISSLGNEPSGRTQLETPSPPPHEPWCHRVEAAPLQQQHTAAQSLATGLYLAVPARVEQEEEDVDVEDAVDASSDRRDMDMPATAEAPHAAVVPALGSAASAASTAGLSVSEVWKDVDLGIVRERSALWGSASPEKPPRSNTPRAMATTPTAALIVTPEDAAHRTSAVATQAVQVERLHSARADFPSLVDQPALSLISVSVTSNPARNIDNNIAKTAELLQGEECKSPLRNAAPEPPAREHIRQSAQLRREQVLQSAQRVDVPNLGSEDHDEAAREERLRQVEQDLCRQQLEELHRLREIEADRLRQEEEEYASRSLRASELRAGHAASTCAGADGGADPELVRQQVERKLRDQRVREERRLRKLREHGSLPAPRFASCSSQSNKGGAVATSPTASWPRAGRPAPAPPARNFEAEAKVMSKIINMAVVPSQQERWRMRKGDEDDDKTSEWEKIKKMQEEQEEMQMRQMEKEMHEAKPECSRSNIQVNADPDSGQHQVREGFSLAAQQQEKAKQLASRPPLKTHISVEEQDKLNEWERLKRQEEEEQELFLRQQERELLGRRPASRGPPPRRHTSPAQMQSDGRAARGAARFARPCEQKRIADWEEIRRREEEAAEMQLREMERQRQKEMDQKRMAEEKLKMQAAIERQWQEEQDAELRRLSQQQQQQSPQRPPPPTQRTSPASPRPPPSPRTPDQPPPPPSPRTPSACAAKNQDQEWLEVKRLQDEEEERQRAAAEREIHKQRMTDEQNKKPSSGSLRGRGRKVRHLTIQEEEHDLELDRLRDEEERERQRLAAVEKRKREIDQELEKERLHLETLAKLQSDSASGAGLEALEQAYAASGDTTRMLEVQRLKHLKALEAQKMQELSKLANGSHDGGMKTDRVSSASEDDTGGFSEGCEDVSLGMDAPNQSGSTTPTPTSGELAEIDSRKSAKSSSDGDEERCSPKKVHFAEANEVKLLPREEPLIAIENS